MNDYDLPYFLLRSETDYHRATLHMLHSKTLSAYDKLVHGVYGHQRAVYPTASDPAQLAPHDPASIAKHFYENCYKPPQLRNGFLVGNHIELDEFVNDVVLAQDLHYRNRVFFLHGDVGTGKTALINYLITTRFKSMVDARQLWFLRLDLEELTGGGIKRLTCEKLLYEVALKAKRVLPAHPEIWNEEPLQEDFRKFEAATKVAIPQAEKEPATTPDASSYHPAVIALEEMARRIAEVTKRRLLLVFDNLDYVCHRRDRSLYEDLSSTGEEDVIRDINRYVDAFLIGSFLGHLSANVLFVCRTDTYKILSLIPSGTSRPRPAAGFAEWPAFAIERPEWRSVLECRNELLEVTADSEPVHGRRKEYLSITKVILAHFNTGSPPLAEHILKLCNHGYRQMMKFFAQYGWATENGESGQELAIERFIHQYPVGLLTFILDEHLLFNQAIDAFPNIYLVRMRAPEGDRAAGSKHPHSYWLKRLICHLVQHHKKCPPEYILSIFHGSGGPGYYRERLVKKVLGSLSEANGPNMLTVHRTRSLSDADKLIIESVMLTERGQHCLNKVFDRFFYLQLIVDDDLLPIPLILEKEFDLETTSPHYNYGYVTKPTTEYAKAAIAMINHKAQLVLLFLEVLDAALTCEKEIYAPVFTRLSTLSTPVVPDVGEIKRSINAELDLLQERHKANINLAPIREYVATRKFDIHSYIRALYSAGARQSL